MVSSTRSGGQLEQSHVCVHVQITNQHGSKQPNRDEFECWPSTTTAAPRDTTSMNSMTQWAACRCIVTRASVSVCRFVWVTTLAACVHAKCKNGCVQRAPESGRVGRRAQEVHQEEHSACTRHRMLKNWAERLHTCCNSATDLVHSASRYES